MTYAEEREFTLRLELRVAFPDDYDGDEDGYAWAADVPPVVAEIVRSAAAIAARHGWAVAPRNRGRSTEDEVTLVLERAPAKP